MNYRAAMKVFTRYNLPTEQLLLLFADILPQKYIDDLISLFSMKVSSSALRGRKATYLNLPVMSEIVLDYLKKR